MISAMKMNISVFVIVIPLFIAFVLPTFGHHLKLVEGLVLSTETIWLLGAGYLASVVLLKDGIPIIYSLGGWAAPWGIELKIDSLAAFFLLIVTGVSLPVALFARGNLADEIGNKERIARFYVLLLLLGGAMAGMALTNDLFNVFVLVEVSTLSCCGLVSARNHPKAAEAAFKYLILATLGSVLVLGGIGFIYTLTGHLNMEFAHRGLNEIWQNAPHVIWMAMSFTLIGFGVKSALSPLHLWLPDAHSIAPTPASAILSGLAVKGYIVCFLKIIYIVFGQNLIQQFNMHRILTLMGMAAIIVGSLFALYQEELKRRLAYSTIAQIGYIFLGLGLMNVTGMKGTLFYLASHAVIKSSLFLAAGAIIAATGKKNIGDLAGIGHKMPITMLTFTIASLGLIGIPIFSGFIGKWYLLLGSLEAGNIFAVAIIILGSVLCAAYLLPIIRIAYFGLTPKENFSDPGLSQKLALIMLAGTVIILGILPGPVLELASRAAFELLTL
mgnify:CR=1 FL=1